MTNLVDERPDIVEKIETKLAAMGDVKVMKDQYGQLSLFKEGIKFGIIRDGKLLLMSKSKKFKEYNFADDPSKEDNEKETDRFITEATKAYWFATDKW